jgi:hypothetical protein
VGPDLVYFKTFTGERSINADVKVRADLFLQRLTPFVEGAFLSSRQRPSAEIDARSRRVESRGAVGVDLVVTPRLSVEVAAFRSSFDYDQDSEFFGRSLRGALARKADGVGLGLRYKLTPKTTLDLVGSQWKDRFDVAFEKNTDSFSVVPGLEFSPRALVSGRARLGVRWLRTRDDAKPDYTGLVAAMDLSYTLQGATTLNLIWDRDVAYSYQPNLPFYLAKSVTGRIRRQIAGRVDAIATVRRVAYDYRIGEAVAHDGDRGRDDVTGNYSLDVGYRLSRTARVGVAVSRWTRNAASGATTDYEGLRAGLTVAIGR